MTDTMISDLPAVTDIQTGDEFVLARAGTTKKISGASLESEIGGGGGEVSVDGVDITAAPRSRINFVTGAAVTLTGTDDSGGDKVDVEIAASGTGWGAVTRAYPIALTTPRTSSLSGNAFWTVAGLTDWDAGHWEFVKDVDGKLYGQVVIPPTYTSDGTVRLTVAANATSGVTRLGIGSKAVADGESVNPTLTDETKQDITVPGTAYLRKDVTFTLTETLAGGDLLIVEIFHEGTHANDTLAVNTLLFGAWLEVTA